MKQNILDRHPLDGKVPVRTLETPDDVRLFFADLIAAGVNFHPDDALAEQVEIKTGAPSFSHEEAARLDAMMHDAWTICGRENAPDIYALGIEAFDAHHAKAVSN